jgi:hypothetical protein
MGNSRSNNQQMEDEQNKTNTQSYRKTLSLPIQYRFVASANQKERTAKSRILAGRRPKIKINTIKVRRRTTRVVDTFVLDLILI